MRLLFKKATYGGLVGRAIALWTRGPYCHVEISFDDSTRMFSSDSVDGGVRFIDRGVRRLHEYDIIELPDVSDEKRAEVMAWATDQLGKKYDWWGVFGFVVPWLHNDSRDWFCSEICCESLIRLGLLADTRITKISPNQLAKIARAKVKLKVPGWHVLRQRGWFATNS